MNTIQHETLEQVLNDIYGVKLCAMNGMSSRAEMIRLLDKATSKLKEALDQPSTTEQSSAVDQLPDAFRDTGSHKFREITAEDFGNDTDEFLPYCLAQDDLQPLYTHLPVDQQPMERSQMCSLIEGMSVSVDVSTGEHDADHRYFGTVTEVMDAPEDKHGVTLLVQDAKPNFDRPPVDQQPVWFHKHWGEQDDIFYLPTDNIPVGSTPLYTHPVNLNCKSAQARLATLWGYEKVSK